MFNSISSSYPVIENPLVPQINPLEQQLASPPVEIIIGPKDSELIVLEKEIEYPKLQELIEQLHQLARFPASADPEKIAQLPSRLNEAMQREPCFLLEHYQVRFLQLKEMLGSAEHLNNERLCSVMKQHLIDTEDAASTLFRDSATPVQDSLWPLYERILCLPSLEPDFFGAAVAILQEKLPYADSSHPLVEQLQDLLPQLLPPSHYLWGQLPPFDEALQKLQEIKQKSLTLRHRLKEVSEGYIKNFYTPMESIFETYRSFLEEFEKASDQKKEALCIPKAQLSGVGLGFFSLDREVARHVLCRDETGKTDKKNPLGTHAVHREAGVFYKPNPAGMYYIGPEMEFAIYAFYQLLGSNGTAPTALAKVRHLFFEGQPQPYGRALQAGYGVEGISLQDLLGMANVLPFLKRSLGAKAAEQAFGELLDPQCEQKFLEAHPELTEEALKPLTLEESADRFIQAFEAIFEPLPETKRCLEFTKLPASNATKREFYSHISTHSTKLLVGALAFLCRYPDLAITYCEGKVRSASFTEITDLYLYLKKSKQCFPLLSNEQLLQELPQLMNRFDSANFSAHFVVTLLTDPYDHKTDNLMVTINRTEQGGVQSLSIVGIDNDLAFAPVEEGIKTILYLLPNMQKSFDPSVAQKLLEATPEGLVLDWLVALEEQNQGYQRWQKQGVLTQQDLFEDGEPSLHIPLEIDTALIPAIYAKAQQLIQLLRANPSETHWNLLKVIRPRLAQAYQKALRTNDTPERAYIDVPRSFTEQGQAAPDSNQKQTPATAGLSFLKRLNLASCPLKLQVSLIGKALRSFPSSAHDLSLPGDAKDPISRRDFFLMAVQQGHCALVARLLEEEKKSGLGSEKPFASLMELKNQEEQTALLMACCRLDLEMIRLLIHYGADPQVCDAGGRTALPLCLMHLPNPPEKVAVAAAVRFLGDQAAVFFNAMGEHSGWGPLHHLVNVAPGAPEAAEPLIAYLIEKGATPDLVDNSGKTALDRAIEQGQECLVKQLIELGAGRTLNVAKARAFFNSRPNLQDTFILLQSHSLLIRWHLTLDDFRALHYAGGKTSIQGAQLSNIALSPELVKTLLDEHGDIRPLIPYGRRNVNKVTISEQRDLYFKQYPEMPGVEYAINKLFELLIGHGTSFTDLAKLTLPNGRSYPVLISQGIQGENLHDVLSKPVKAKQLEKLDPLFFSELLLASLLVNFEDAKPDNFILEKTPAGTYRLVGIDNDHAFVPPLVKENGTIVQVKCILYCLDLMKQPIHPSARERFLSFSPERMLHLWLNLLVEQNQQYCTLFPKEERSELFKETKQRTGVVIPIPFRPGAMADIYQKFQRLQIALRESPQLTGIELLRLVIPPLGIRYEEAFHAYNDPLKRFQSLTDTQYSIAIDGRRQTLVNSRQMLQSMSIPEKSAWNEAAEQGPALALQELDSLQRELEASAQQLRRIRDALQAGEVGPFQQLQLDTTREKVVNGIPGAFKEIDFNAMQVLGAADLKKQNDVLSAILIGNYRSLRLNGCVAFNEVAFEKLLRYSPQLLSLELRECPAVTEDMLIQLSQAQYLSRLRLNNLSQLSQISLPHPTLRRLEIVNCQGLQLVTISHTLKSLSIDACWNLSSVEVKLYEKPAYKKVPWYLPRLITPLNDYPKLTKPAPRNFVLQPLQLKACPKLLPWCEIFGSWLKKSPKHQIQLQKVPPNLNRPDHIAWVLRAVLQQSDAEEMIASLMAYYPDNKIGKLISLINDHQNINNPSTKLDLSDYCDEMSDTMLEMLIKGRQNLTFVNISGCDNITDRGLRALAKGCPNLIRVSLFDCNAITSRGIQALHNGCPNLASIKASEYIKPGPEGLPDWVDDLLNM